jgi:hypothetical protein
MDQCLSWEANSSSASLEFPLHFMEYEGSSARSQEPAICLYPEPDESSPCYPILFLTDPL